MARGRDVKYSIITLGCRVNQADSLAMAAALQGVSSDVRADQEGGEG